MIKFLNKYFVVIMMFFIISTTYFYKNRINNFIKNSEEYTLVISSHMSEERKNDIEKKLKKLTFQDVFVEENENVVIVKIKCPPDKFNLFSKLICEWANRRD